MSMNDTVADMPPLPSATSSFDLANILTLCTRPYLCGKHKYAEFIMSLCRSTTINYYYYTGSGCWAEEEGNDGDEKMLLRNS